MSSDPKLNGYEGTYPVDEILKKLPIHNDSRILDIGCGKGLFLYYAKSFPFKVVDGLEYDAGLVNIAVKNIQLIGDDRLHVYHVDARKFSEYERYDFYFVNNPFDAEILAEVIDCIVKSVNEKPRQITVIYQFPSHKQEFINKGFKLIYDQFPQAILTFQLS